MEFRIYCQFYVFPIFYDTADKLLFFIPIRIHNIYAEESLTELENKNRHYIQFGVSDSKTAARILQSDLRIQNFKVCDQHILQVMDVNVPIALINRTFIQNGLEVSEAHMCEDTLEDYFKQVTGGEGIA